jgi:tetrahedral aminopeptidase
LPIQELMKRLSEARGVSGYEAGIRPLVAEEFRKHADEVRADVMGSLIACKHGTGGTTVRRSIMLAGHMDEIGLIVTNRDKAFLRFATVGGFDPRVLLGQEVVVHGRRDLPGVVGTRPPHVLSERERSEVVPLDHLFIDVGMSEAEVRETVRVGDIITLQGGFVELSNGMVAGKALDDRAAVACLADCLERLAKANHTWDVYAVATVQEEVGCKGAITSTFALTPDVGIAIDVTHGNMPGVSEADTVRVGDGPAIGLGPNIHPKMYSRLVETAKASEIPYQIEAIPGASGTDAWAMQVAREGLPTALLSLPLRYMHTPVETLLMKDVERTSRLLADFIICLDDAFAADLGLGDARS